VPGETVNVRLPSDLFERLGLLSWAENRSRSDLIYEAVAAFLVRRQQDPSVLKKLQVLLEERPEDLEKFLAPIVAPTANSTNAARGRRARP